MKLSTERSLLCAAFVHAKDRLAVVVVLVALAVAVALLAVSG